MWGNTIGCIGPLDGPDRAAAHPYARSAHNRIARDGHNYAAAHHERPHHAIADEPLEPAAAIP